MPFNQTVDTPPVENILSEDFDSRSLLRFSFPTIFMMVFFGLYTIVDTIFVARYVNTNALSAINIVTPVVNIIVGLATMFATGGSAIIARKMGEGKNIEACSNFSLIIAVSTLTGLFMTGIGIFFLDPLLKTLGASAVLMPYCRDYLVVLLLFAPANMMQVIFTCLFVTAGKPKLGMKIGVTAGLVNAILDYLFIVFFSMGIKGAALATGIGYSIPMIAGIVFFAGNRRGTLFLCVPKIDLRILGESAFNGSSEMVGQLSTGITTFLFNTSMMAIAGENGVAAITIMIYIQFLLTTFFIGFSVGVAPVISYNYGRRNQRYLKKIVKISLRIIFIVSFTVSVLALSFDDMLIEIFTPNTTPVYNIAHRGFFIFVFALLFIGFNIFSSAMFTALSNGILSAMVSFPRNILVALGIIFLPGLLGINGVWLSVPLAEFISLILAVYIFLENRKKYHYI